jgi:hypothetical protein
MVAMVNVCILCEVYNQAEETAWLHASRWNCLFISYGIRHLGELQTIPTKEHYYHFFASTFLQKVSGCHAKQKLGKQLQYLYTSEKTVKVISYFRDLTNSCICEVRFWLLKVVGVTVWFHGCDSVIL